MLDFFERSVGVLLFLGLSLVPLCWGETSPPLLTLSPNLPQREALLVEAKLIQAFAKEDCADVLAIAPEKDAYTRVTPLSIAIVASCFSDPGAAERDFLLAEKSEPGRAEIYFLHAYFRWKRDPQATRELWEKVISVASVSAVRTLARRYLDGTATAGEKIDLESRWSYYADLRQGIGNESNPGLVATSPEPNHSLLWNTVFNGGVQKGLSFGNLGANYSLTFKDYPQASQVSLLQHDLDFPITFRAGTRENIQLIPFGRYLSVGGSRPYSYFGGLSVTGVAYRGNYRQQMQGSLYWDRFPDSALSPMAGTHFRFDYRWEFYPGFWFVRLSFAIEHVQAGRRFNSVSGTSIPFSHNDLSLDASAEYDFRWLILGLSTRLSLRENDNSARYTVDGEAKQKRREDLQIFLQPSVAIPVRRGIHVIGSCFLDRLLSNIGPNDYEDPSFFNKGVQFSIRATLEAL